MAKNNYITCGSPCAACGKWVFKGAGARKKLCPRCASQSGKDGLVDSRCPACGVIHRAYAPHLYCPTHAYRRQWADRESRGGVYRAT